MIPTPHDKEDKAKFVSRCMSSEVMKKDYPDGKQRVAVCLGQTKKSKSSLLEEVAENIVISNAFLDSEEKDAWKKSQAQDDPNEEVYMLKSQINKIMNQAKQMLELLNGMTNMEIPPWVQDSISKSETHIETAYDYMLYSDEKHTEDTEDTEDAESSENPKVKLNKPFRTSNGPKKFSVYVKNEKNNVVKVNFGDPNMEIKRDDPARRKSFRARHNCDNPGPKWKANYWSCKMWSRTNVSDIT